MVLRPFLRGTLAEPTALLLHGLDLTEPIAATVRKNAGALGPGI